MDVTNKTISKKIVIISWSILLVILLSTIFIYSCLNIEVFIDDAFISFRFAENLAQGHGFRFNPGSEKVEGFSNFLWVVFLSLNLLFKLNIAHAATIWGIIFSCCSLLIYLRIVNSLSSSDKYFWITPILLVLNNSFIFNTLTGLETSLYILLILNGIYFFIIEEKKENTNKPTKFFVSNVFFVLVSMTRPEGMIYFIGIIFYKLCNKNLSEKNYLRSVAFRFYQFVLFFSVYLIWKWSYFGDIFPTSYYVKIMMGTFEDRILRGFIYVFMFFKENLFFLWGLVASLLFFFKYRRKIYLLLFIFILLNFFFIFYSGGDDYHFKQWRFFVPVIFLLLILFQEMIVFLLGLLKTRIKQYICVIILFLTYILNTDNFFLIQKTKECRISRFFASIPILSQQTYKYLFGFNGSLDELVGQWLSQHYSKNTIFAAHQAGQMPFHSGLNFVDLLGIATKNVSFVKRYSPEYFLLLKKASPDIFVLLHSELFPFKDYLVNNKYLLNNIFLHAGSKRFFRYYLFAKQDGNIIKGQVDLNKDSFNKPEVIIFKDI